MAHPHTAIRLWIRFIALHSISASSICNDIGDNHTGRAHMARKPNCSTIYTHLLITLPNCLCVFFFLLTISISMEWNECAAQYTRTGKRNKKSIAKEVGRKPKSQNKNWVQKLEKFRNWCAMHTCYEIYWPFEFYALRWSCRIRLWATIDKEKTKQKKVKSDPDT